MAKTTIHVQTMSSNVKTLYVNSKSAYPMTKFAISRRIVPTAVMNPYIVMLMNVHASKTMAAIINA